MSLPIGKVTLWSFRKGIHNIELWSGKGTEANMGRLLRFAKLAICLGGVFCSIVLFNNFMDSPNVDEGIAENLQNQVKEQLDKGKDLTTALVGGEEKEPLDDHQRTQWFHKQVQEQKEKDQKANEARENSYIYHFDGKRWVFIQGKYYEYNPDNTYNVNGIPTMFLPPGAPQKGGFALSIKNQQLQKITSTKIIRQPEVLEAAAISPELSLLDDPGKAYTKDGMAQLKQNLKDIRVRMKERNHALKELGQSQ